MSKHRKAGPGWDSAYETADFLAEVAIGAVLEQYGHQSRHVGDVSSAMISAIESAAETVEQIKTRSPR